MTINIKNPEAERKLRQVARLLGKSLTATIIDLTDSRLKEIEAKQEDRERRLREVDEIVRRVNSLPPPKLLAAKRSALRRG
jgi:hypothetical protein